MLFSNRINLFLKGEIAFVSAGGRHGGASKYFKKILPSELTTKYNIGGVGSKSTDMHVILSSGIRPVGNLSLNTKRRT